MVANGGGLSDLKMLDVAHLFERPMILLDLPVLVVELEGKQDDQKRPNPRRSADTRHNGVVGFSTASETL